MIEVFGNLPNGDAVKWITISNANLTVKLITYGASIQDIRFADHGHSLVLGFSDLNAYLDYPYFGAMVGRVANRIENGRFEIDGTIHQLNRNENDRTTLHGGRNSISFQNWTLIDHDQSSATMRLIDQESQSGFPGDCEITCRYFITDENCLEYEIAAVSTKNTICNIAHHSYFNLSGEADILAHELQINAPHYLPVNQHLIPTGEVKKVENSIFDFQVQKRLMSAEPLEIDHNFCLPNASQNIRKIGSLYAPQSRICMEIETTEPGLQVYTGSGINVPIAGHNGVPYSPYSGIALEPQGWPNACNEAHFPSIHLKAGEVYRQNSRFNFSKH